MFRPISLCALCDNDAVVVYVYRDTGGEVLDRDSLCRKHLGLEAK